MKESNRLARQWGKGLAFCLLLLCTTLVPTSLLAQVVGHVALFDANNSSSRRAIMHYAPDAQGFFQKSASPTVERVDNIVEIYAFNKRLDAIYVLTEVGNYEVQLSGALARELRRQRALPHLSGKELNNAIAVRNIQLMTLIDQRNAAHRQAVEEALAQRRQWVADSLQAAQDSLEQVRWAATQQARAEERRAQYRENHPWNLLPIKGALLICLDAGCSHELRADLVPILGMSGDTIFYSTLQQLPLDFQYEQVHKALLPASLRDKADFRYHWDVFADSLQSHPYSSHQQTLVNTEEYQAAVQRLKDYAPWGYVSGWQWSLGANVSFRFTYHNLADRPLRDVDVHWSLATPAGEVRTTGHFKGNGLLKSGGQQSWQWDTSSYTAPTDATRMTLTKIVLTFTDGKQQVIPQHAIRIEQ